MTDRIAEIRERAKVTLDEMRRACKRTPPIITMRIPAEPERDLDILVDQLCTNDIPYLLAQLDAARAEVERLRAAVDKLPKTADGVPIYPNMTVWMTPEVNCTAYADHIGIVLCFAGSSRRSLGAYDPDEKCYSTREAAEAARTRA